MCLLAPLESPFQNSGQVFSLLFFTTAPAHAAPSKESLARDWLEMSLKCYEYVCDSSPRKRLLLPVLEFGPDLPAILEFSSL